MLLLLAACTPMTEAEREYAQVEAYTIYLERKSLCRGTWVTTFEERDAHRQHPVDLRRAFCSGNPW